MSDPRVTSDDFLTISPRIRVLPIIHGSGDFAIQVREELLSRPYDCVAVPLPPSFQEEVEAAVERLPTISVVVQVDAETDGGTGEEPDADEIRAGLQLRADRPLPGGDRRAPHGAGRADRARVHRPGDAAVRLGHRRPSPTRTRSKRVSPERFAAAILAAVPPPPAGQVHRAHRLDGGAAPRAGIAVSPDPLRLLDPRLALDSRRLPAPARRPPSPSRSSRRSRPSPSIPGR